MSNAPCKSPDEVQSGYCSTVDGLLIADVETKRVVWADSAICQTLGHSTEELLSLSVMDIHPREELPAVLENFQAQAEGRIQINEAAPLLRKDGSVVYADITSKAITYRGRPCLIKFFRDITGRKRPEAALRGSEERAAARGWFVRLWKPSIMFRVLYQAAILLCISVVSFLIGHMQASHAPPTTPAPPSLHGGTVALKPGPWGKLEWVPMSIAPPNELLPVRVIEGETVHWFFGGMSRDALAKFLDSLDLPGGDRERLLSPLMLQVLPEGIDLAPPRDIVVSLPPKARREIYARLALFPEENGQVIFFRTSSVDERLQKAAVSNETIALFKKLSCPYGEYTVLSGLPSLLAAIPSYEEKARLLRAVYQSDTLLLRLYVTSDSDIDALAAYWGKAFWSTDIKSLLDSLAHVPGGTWVDIVEVLPPLPAAMIYTFPKLDNPANGPAVLRNCHWTACNFFRDPPDPNFSNLDYVGERLKKDYFPVASDPRYGDLVFFALPKGKMIHSAVFLADDVVYTKNGKGLLSPWMLSTIPELLKQYSFSVPPDQKLSVMYYRSKSY